MASYSSSPSHQLLSPYNVLTPNEIMGIDWRGIPDILSPPRSVNNSCSSQTRSSTSSPASLDLNAEHSPSPFTSSRLTSKSVAWVRPHAPPSRCVRARIRATENNLEREHGELPNSKSCNECRASEAHHLAATAMDHGETVTGFLGKAENIKHKLNRADVFGNTPLHFLAGVAPDFERLDGLMRLGANIHFKNSDGETFLHILKPRRLRDNLLAVLDLCRCRRFDFQQRTTSGVTVMQALFAKISDLSVSGSIIPLLPNLGIDIYARDSLGNSPVKYLDHWQRRIGTLQMPSPEGPMSFHDLRLRYAPDPRERLPVAESGQESGPHEYECNGIRPEDPEAALIAADKAMSKVVERSAHNPKCEDRHGKTALICLMHMVDPRDGPSTWPSSLRREGLVYKCIKVGVDVNAYDQHGSTALHYLLSKPRGIQDFDEKEGASILRLLLQKNADVHLQDRQGATALHLACASGWPECTRLLIEHISKGSSHNAYAPGLNARNNAGKTVIAEAQRALAAVLRIPELPGEAERIQHCINQVVETAGVEYIV